MYSPFQLLKKYISYYLTASNGNGHGVHSPFVFDFITKVLNDKSNYPCYAAIELQRKKLLQNNTCIEVRDEGAGSVLTNGDNRIIRHIASSSLKPKKYAQLLYRIVSHYKPKTILELGTSLGITTCYLAAANQRGLVYTMEGSHEIAEVASACFRATGNNNIHLIEGNFNTQLPLFLQAGKNIDFAFIDGNHLKGPTLDYFNQLLASCKASSIIILDDIHWSKGMEEAWAQIMSHDKVTLTIDLFFIGLVFIDPQFKVRQHFKIRF